MVDSTEEWRMDLTREEEKLITLLQEENIDLIKEFVQENENVCTSKIYDKAVQQAIATNNRSLASALSEVKGFQASVMTFKLAASMGYLQEFTCMLENRNELTDNTEIYLLLIAALQTENILSINKLNALRRDQISPPNNRKPSSDVVDSPNIAVSCFQCAESDRLMNQTLDESDCEISFIDCESNNSVKIARERISRYKIIADPLYIILHRKEPIKASVILSKRLRDLANQFPANKNEFTEISVNCKKLAVDLLDCCENNEEVDNLLEYKNVNEPISPQCILWQMMDEKFVEFVTHSNCQYWLYRKWCGKIGAQWEIMPLGKQLGHIITHTFLSPIICMYYAIVPPPAEERVPMNSFIYSVSTYCCFMLLLLYSVFYDKIHGITKGFAEPDYAVGVWVIACLLHLIKDYCSVPYPSFSRSWWNLYQIVMLILFLCAGVATFLASMKVLPPDTSAHVAFAAEGIYAVAITIAFMRPLQWFLMTSRLGPVIISFSRMTTVILKLLVIFGIVLFAFSFGLYRLYRHFHVKGKMPENGTEIATAVFTRYRSTLKSLFWVVFGYGEPDDIEIPNDYVWKSQDNIEITREQQHFVMVIGYILWALFHVAFVIVLLNMLIAIMTTSFERIQIHSDDNWKYARTKLWMYYIEENNVVPPPYNLLTYFRKIFFGVRKTWRKCSKLFKESGELNSTKDIAVIAYQETLLVLIERYENKRFENSVHKANWGCNKVSYVDARKRLLKEKFSDLQQLWK